MVPTITLAALAAALAVAPATQGTQASAHDARLTRSTFLMGTTLHLDLKAASRAEALSASEAVFQEARRTEAVLSSWRPESELSRLNRLSVGESMRLTPELHRLLEEVGAWVRSTDGAFDPAVGPLVDAWDLRGAGAVPSPEELDAALESSGWAGFRLQEGRARRTRPGLWMTAGAFGKGAALRSAAAVLRESGIDTALLDFGGQLLALGRPDGDDGWPVSVAHPGQRDQEVVRLVLRDESAATSGASERFIRVDGVRYGHVIDPRTGRPVQAWGSATVVAEDPLEADILSTALFVMGPDSAKSWLRSNPGVDALLLIEEEAGVKAWWTPGLTRRLLYIEEPAFADPTAKPTHLR